MKKIYVFLFVFAFSFTSFSQSVDTANVPVWAEMMQDENANFFEIQKAFELYFEGRERQPGDGWKVFKRWEDLTRKRVNDDGSFSLEDEQAEAFEAWSIWNLQTNMQGVESENGAWEEVGPIAKPDNGTGQPNGNGRLNTICFHPTSADTMWVGAPAGGLWKTTDGGETWSTNTDELATLGVSSVLVDPTNTDIMYMGTGDRDAGDAPNRGVYKSTDGGQNWTQSNSGMGNRAVGAMVMHPSNSSIIIAATNGGIYRTQNAGSSWTLESSNTSNYKDLKYKPGSSTVVYASETSSGAGFYRSTDGGDTWTQITSGLPSNAQRYSIGVSEDDASVVYLLCSVSSAYGGLYKSTDSGVTFSTQSTSPNLMGWSENGSGGGGQGWYDLAIAVDPDDADVVYVGGVNIWKSVNSGVTWDCSAHWVGSSTAASVHADQHWFAFSPNDDRLYACNDGGLYYTDDDGATWPELSAGLGIAQLYKIGVSQQTHALVINGYQDNGTAIWDDTLFRTERGGDGMECLINYDNDDVMYASVYYGNIARSLNNGYNFGSFAANNTNGITESGAWVTPYILDKDNPDIMFIGYKNVWRTTTATGSWVNFDAISNSLAGSNSTNMRQLRQSKVDGNRLFAIRGDNKFFRSDNALAASPTWTDLTAYLPISSTLRDVETDPYDEDILWISIGNQIWKSYNGGTSWTNITGSLPNLNYYTIVADPLSDGGLYVGGYAGIYYIDNSLSNWISFFDDFPASASVRELEIYHPVGNWEGSRIRAATYGRGLWESDLYNPGNIAPLPFVDLSLDSTDICTPDTIHLYNNSAYGVDSSFWEVTPSSGVSYVLGTSDTSMNPIIVLSDIGTYDVKLSVTNSNGTDSLVLEDAIVLTGGIGFPWYDDFENEINCQTGNCEASCNVVNWKNVTNGAGDQIDWRPDNEGTPWSVANYNGSTHTGPSIDYDPGSSAGHYLYLSAYPPYTACYNKVGLLESPCLSLDSVTSPEMKFAFHMYGSSGSFADLDIDVFSNGSWTNVHTVAGTNYGDAWQLDSVSLSSYVGQNVKLRFAGQSGSGWVSDVAIDGVLMSAAPQAEFSVSDETPCLNQTVSFTDESTQSPSSWAWTITPNTFNYVNGTSGSTQNPEVEFTADGSYSITLFATNAYGDDFEAKSGYIQVQVPPATLSTNASNDEFCSDDTATLTVVETGYVNYEFFKNSNSVGSGISDSYIENSLTAGDQYYTEVTDSSGCIGTSNTITISLFPAQTSILSSSDGDNIICDGDTVVFTAINGALLNYDFLKNSASIQSSASNVWTTSELVNNDEVYVSFLDSNGCVGTTDTIATRVLPLPPTPSITLVLDSLQCSIPANMYRWEFTDSSFVNNDQTVAKEGDGDYRVRIFDGGCWSAWSDPFIITGFDGIEGLSLKVYPNPASTNLNLEFVNGINASKAELLLVDMNGKLILTDQLFTGNNNYQHSIDLGGVPSGVYTLILSLDGKNHAIPFVKESR